jgi:two-component system chemotaxis response regulator CheY
MKGAVMKKILIADDSMFMRMTLKNTLPKEYEIIEAASGAEALEQFKEQKPDLVLLDIVMPGGEEEGLDVLRKIMKSDTKACVVMISAVGQDAIIDQCKKLGAKDYIVKPFDEKQVADVVQKYLGKEVLTSSCS